MQVQDLPIDKLIELMFKGTDMMRVFAKNEILPIIETLQNLTKQEEAVRLVYFRMCLVLNSLSRLNRWSDFQLVNAAARTMFELAMDLLFLANDTDGKMVKRFFAFRDVERFRTGSLIVKFYEEERGESVPTEHRAIKQLVEKPGEKARVLKLRKKHWRHNKKTQKPIQPQHWTSMDNKARAKELDRLLGTDYEKI